MLDNYGSTQAQMIGVAGLYGLSLFLQHERLHEFTVDVIHSIVIEIPITTGLKYAFNARRPDGDPRGFPSGHAASSFALAAALEKNFGLWAGLAGYTAAGLVSFHRIDDGRHHLSDVIFGAAIGYVVGSSAAANEPPTPLPRRLVPFVDPIEAVRGLSLEWRF
jgi:membrane-associated phospholipid phosphatase